jgi:DNA topoisomerase-1
MLQALIKWYKFPVDKTTKLAQGLFEKGFITYIRTDSPAISPEATEAIRGYLKDNNLPISAKVLKYESKQANAQEAHEAIRVTDVNAHYSETDLSEDERKLYEVIWKHTVACQMAPAIYDTMKVTLQIDGTKETLVSSGKALKSKGYLEILGGGNKAEKIDIPPLKKGDKVSVSTSKVEEKQTQPPPRFNTSELLEFMKKNSIGRPATVPTLLKKVTDRGYVTVVNEVFRPTELGNKVSELLSKNFKFMDIKFTAYMENLLDDIAAGRASYKDTIQKFWDEFTKQLDTAYSNVSTKDDGSPKCPQCGASMVERNGKFGTFWGCSSWKRTGCKGLINIGAAPWEKK